MQKLTKREEQLMQVFWQLEKAFIKDVIPNLPEPKPHYNSVATIVKILEEKGFLTHESVGNIFCYSPLVSKDDYQKLAMEDVVTQYFNGSYPSMLAFFAKEQKLSEKDLLEIVKLIKTPKK